MTITRSLPIKRSTLQRAAHSDEQYDDQCRRQHADPFSFDGDCDERGGVNTTGCGGDPQYLRSCMRLRLRYENKSQCGKDIQKN